MPSLPLRIRVRPQAYYWKASQAPVLCRGSFNGGPLPKPLNCWSICVQEFIDAYLNMANDMLMIRIPSSWKNSSAFILLVVANDGLDDLRMSTLEKVAAILQRCSQAAIKVKESGCVHGTWIKAVVETSEFRIGKKAINLWINLRGYSGCSRPRSQQQNEQGFPPAKDMANLFTPAHLKWKL